MGHRKVLLGIIAVVTFFFLLEICSRLYFAIPVVRSRLPWESDSAFRIQWVDRYRASKNRDPAMGTYFFFDRYHPTRGWSLAPNLSSILIKPGVRLSTDEWGIRATGEKDSHQSKKRLKIAVLGDSFTFGEGVNDHEAFPAQWAQLAPELQVFNLGVHGYGHDQMLLYLKELGPRLQPDWVVLAFASIDVERNLFSFRDFAKPRFVMSDRGELPELEQGDRPIPTPSDWLRHEVWRSSFLDAWDIFFEKIRWKNGQNVARSKIITEALLVEMNEECKRLGARFVVASIPVVFHGQPMLFRDGSNPEAWGVQVAKQRGLQWRSLSGVFHSTSKAQASPFLTDGHYSPFGHRLIAEGLKKELKQF